MSIKYYQLAKDEELPDEFCAVRDVGGEPSEYTFYVPEDENAKLRELVTDMWSGMCGYGHDCRYCEHYELYEGQRFVGKCEYHRRMRELGVEVDE